MRIIKYTRENIEPVITGSISVRQALSKLGLKADGGHKRLRLLIMQILSEEETYKGKGHNGNKFYIKVLNEDYFIKSPLKRSSSAVKEALFKRKIKIEYKCERCGNGTWLENPIPLELHHKDGDKRNNSLENLEILCPNCHYFTDTYKSKNVGRMSV